MDSWQCVFTSILFKNLSICIFDHTPYVLRMMGRQALDSLWAITTDVTVNPRQETQGHQGHERPCVGCPQGRECAVDSQLCHPSHRNDALGPETEGRSTISEVTVSDETYLS